MVRLIGTVTLAPVPARNRAKNVAKPREPRLPMGATQELNRCLTCVRVAASRRRNAAPLAKQARRRNDAADRRPAAIAAAVRFEPR